ncbi:MAG: ATP-grasp domain-containing protein [Elusimicrobia bacterium]|nr:ATP-grasp domain-containing protein [Elusimicrobiota bacterium]
MEEKKINGTALVLTGEANDFLAPIACQELGELGLRSAVAGIAGSGRLLRLSRWCSSRESVAASSAELASPGTRVLERIEDLARRSGAAYLFCGDVAGSVCAAALRERLPQLKAFPVPDPSTLGLMNDKWSFYEFLVKLGIPTPRTWLIETAEQVRALALPLVLKPLRLSAGLGIHVVKDAAELSFRLGADEHLRLPIIAQELIDGQDVDLSFLAHEGRLNAWSVQTRRADGTIDFIADERVVDIGRMIARASRYTGIAHIDMRYAGPQRAQVKVLECNPRIWASLPQNAGLGADFMGRWLEIAYGRVPPPLARTPTGECANVRGILKKAALGKRLSVCESVFLRRACRDPLPILARGALRILGLRPRPGL